MDDTESGKEKFYLVEKKKHQKHYFKEGHLIQLWKIICLTVIYPMVTSFHSFPASCNPPFKR